MIDRDELKAAEAKGREEGREEGVNNIAINMLRQGLGIALIAQYTGLSLEEVKAIDEKLK